MITISVETLKDGVTIRATGRIDGRTVEYFEGRSAVELVDRALKAVAGHHALPGGGYDMTYIQVVGDAAPSVYREPQSEQAFRTWQAKHNAALVTNWMCSAERDRECSFDRFCLLRYTGRLTFSV